MDLAENNIFEINGHSTIFFVKIIKQYNDIVTCNIIGEKYSDVYFKIYNEKVTTLKYNLKRG